jgi:L-2-hydroxyglutarate oxidase LhgO
MLDAREARALEPAISCVAALLVPSTGLVDSHELMRAYLVRAKEGGADVVYGVSLEGAEKVAGGYLLRLREHSGETTEMECRLVVNAAGNSCDEVAGRFGIDVDAAGYRIHHNRGHYFRVRRAGGEVVSRLIYPVPPVRFASLGIHITLDKAGQVRLGPDAEYLDPALPEGEWYKFEAGRMQRFFEAVVRYYPALKMEDLTPDQVGVRPKLQGPGEEVRDFVITEESGRGLPGLVNLIGIESPGLTSSAEIARMVFGELLEG